MSIVSIITLLLVGLALLIAGAELLVGGVSGLAAAIGVPPLVIGLTVVAFGTSMPEMVINTMSAARGQTDLAFGNIVGACTLNIGVVLAVTALVRPLDVQVSVITREIPMMILGVAALVVLSLDRLANGAAVDELARGDGVMLLLLFGVFLYYTVMQSIRKKTRDAFIADVQQQLPADSISPHSRRVWIDLAILIAGIAGVAIGGRVAVDAAVGIARALQVPEVLIGLTLLSFGTTLPELATGVIAARRGQGDLAIGNVVGSNIFNILCIGGVTSIIRPIPLPQGARIDLMFMAALSVALLPLAIRGPRRITRAEGALLLTGYVGYTAWRTFIAARQ